MLASAMDLTTITVYTILLCLIAFSRAQSSQSHKLIRFQACSGFVRSRLGMALGTVIAKETNRMLVMPAYTPVRHVRQNATYPISDLYDIDSLEDFLQSENIGFTRDAGLEGSYIEPSCRKGESCLKQISQEYGNENLLLLGCPSPSQSLTKQEVIRNKPLFLKVLNSMKPSSYINSLIERAERRLEMFSGQTKYNVLDVRMEKYWFEYCDNRVAVSDNCLNGTFSLGEHLQSKGVENDTLLYVTSNWPFVEEEIKDRVWKDLEKHGYAIVTHTSVTIGFKNSDGNQLSKEEEALVDYYLALKADKFLGNSVSTFSALIILERQHKGLWASYYNGGIIPLQKTIPLYDFPWVFAYNSWSPQVDYLMQISVRSAIAVGGIAPHCMFIGDQNSSIYKWMQDQGVVLISYRPNWITKLTELNTKHRHIPIFRTSEAIVATFQRVDVPVVEELKQYNYVLFSDNDVLFKQRISLSDFPQPLPPKLGMAPELKESFPYNAGIILFNTYELRKSHDELVHFILTESDGLRFGRYGPVDQGAINQFYEEDIKAWKLPESYNAKPYKEYDNDAVIVHFHGPKPDNYLELLHGADKCSRGGPLCRIDGGFCEYIVKDWFKYINENEMAQEVNSECEKYLAGSSSQQVN